MTPSPFQPSGLNTLSTGSHFDHHRNQPQGGFPTQTAAEAADGRARGGHPQTPPLHAGNQPPTASPTTGALSSAAGTTAAPASEASSKLAQELNQFTAVASKIRGSLNPAPDFSSRCQQAFDVANDLFANAPTWVCFYRELMGGNGMLHALFSNNKEFGAFLRTDQHHQIQLMLTALRSRDLPENDPNDPQRMITVRLPKSLHEAMCEEAGRLNISVNRLCISRMLQLLDPEMIPETNSKPRGRKPRTRSKASNSNPTAISSGGAHQPAATPGSNISNS